METCYQKIKKIQARARDSKEDFKPRFPMIIMKSPKGWTTIKEVKGQKIEGTILAHQVVMPGVRGDETELQALEDWLKSYHFEELFDAKKGFDKEILDLLPPDDLLIGDNPHMFGKNFKKLLLPDAKKLIKKSEFPGQIQ